MSAANELLTADRLLFLEGPSDNALHAPSARRLDRGGGRAARAPRTHLRDRDELPASLLDRLQQGDGLVKRVAWEPGAC